MREEDFSNLLRKYDVLVARREYSYRGVYRAYLDCGFEKDLLLTEEAIKKLYPDYLQSYSRLMKNSAGNYVANMYVMSKKKSDEYCKWLFDILTYVEERCDLSMYNQQEARIYGYLSERLLDVWVQYNKLNTKELRVLNTEEIRNAGNLLTDVLSAVGVYQLVKSGIFKIKSMKNKEKI